MLRRNDMDWPVGGRMGWWGAFLLGVWLVLWGGGAGAHPVAIYSQPASVSGGVLPSSKVMPDGSDSDMYVYEGFTVAAAAGITEVRWEGGYQYGAQYGKVNDFMVTFYGVIEGTSQPNMGYAPSEEQPNSLANFYVGGNAEETALGVVGGIAMYSYRFVLPSPFQVTPETLYWIRIEGIQPTYPDWGIAVGTGVNGGHIRFSTGMAMFQGVPKDAAFTLYAEAGADVSIDAVVEPPGAGEVMGTGVYAGGAMVSLSASANAGFGFVEWQENGVAVSSASPYVFTASVDRTLTAVFAPAYTIATESQPSFGGTATGGGIYNEGTEVVVSAEAGPGYVFAYWAEGGTPVSVEAVYAFPATRDMSLMAVFEPDGFTAAFDFDTGSPTLQRGMIVPFTQTVNGLTASFSSPQGGAYSVQGDSNLFYHMAQFGENYLWPNNLSRNHLQILFDRPVVGISMQMATVENQNPAEVPSIVQLSAYVDSTANAPVGVGESRGSYAGDTWPSGVLTFDSGGVPFNLVDVYVPYNSYGTTNFMVDNIVVLMAPTPATHSADQNGDQQVDLHELLRLIQLYNAPGYGCAVPPESTEDGYVAVAGGEQGCAPHTSDYAPQDWNIELGELLRAIQFYNVGGYHSCVASEDGYCPGTG